MLELSPRRTGNPQAKGAKRSQQSRKLLLALVLLLVALAAVLINDRQFWFGTNSTIADDVPEGSVPSQAPIETAAAPKPVVSRAAHRSVQVSTPSVETKIEETPAVVTNRTALAPLDVEVVSGAKHKVVRPGSNSTKLEIADANASAPAPAQPATNAAQREPVTAATAPSYPPLAQHMNVQGSVVLQALIASDGSIENLRVMSGPAILAAAAQQAVREWHFKPITQNGQRVESKAVITVNFTIKVADNSANATIAESRPDDTLIITR
jgi:TonB family protein